MSSGRPESTAIGRPGTEGIWTFVFLDMAVFALMFLVYLSERMRLPALFATAQHHLNPLIGLGSALVLLTSSWCMVEAVRAARTRDRQRVVRFLTFSLALGGLFVANKLFEYSDKIGDGVTPATDSFFTFYFVITGLHFMHVIGGMAFMLNCCLTASSQAGTARYQSRIENVGLFWHFVDVLWLFIFPMLYLTGLR